MSKQKKFILSVVVIILIFGIFAFFASKEEINKDSALDGFAQCLTEKGAKFYGTFWCSHCQKQKKSFGSSMKHINYIECSTPNGRDQTDVCKEANVDGYPTWEFSDGSRLSGELSLDILANKTSCQLSLIK